MTITVARLRRVRPRPTKSQHTSPNSWKSKVYDRKKPQSKPVVLTEAAINKGGVQGFYEFGPSIGRALVTAKISKTVQGGSHRKPNFKPISNRPYRFDSTRWQLANRLVEGQAFTSAQRLALAKVTVKNYNDFVAEMLDGACLTAEVASKLNKKEADVLGLVEQGKVLALLQGSSLVYPTWQFDSDSGDGILRGLPEVLEALQTSTVGKISWLLRANVDLGGRQPVTALKDGDVSEVINQARTVGVL